MKYDPDTHHRRSVRLRVYDYAQPGAYFATICTHDRECLFGEVVEGQMRVNICGQAVQLVWNELPQHYRHVGLDAFVVMPNHVHMIIVLTDDNPVGAGLKPAPTNANTTMAGKRRPLSEFVRAFKTFSARHVNELRGTPGVPVWQRNYYEHIIRDEDELPHPRIHLGQSRPMGNRRRQPRAHTTLTLGEGCLILLSNDGC